MYGFAAHNLRIVIPKPLRHQAIINLHAAHQGTTSLLNHACKQMYWPGMDREVNTHTMRCRDCRQQAPSQQNEPLILAPIPEYPFQHVVANLFQKDGHHYLAYAKLSN